MKLLLKRIYNCKDYCIGHLYVDGQYNNDDNEHDPHVKWHYICDTIEDTDRMLDESMSISKIQSIKIKSQTAIPTGTYNVLMNIVSPKFALKQYYMDICRGKVPRLDNVKGYAGILMHCGINQNSSAGCIIVGYNKIRGRVVYSKQAFEKLYSILKAAYNKTCSLHSMCTNKGDKITITITRTY